MNDNRDHLRALHAMYVECTGIAVTLSPLRLRELREFDRRGLSADDVRAVLVRIRWHMERGTKGYTETSLDWRNAMAVDTFEERALKLRQERLRKAGARPPRAVAQTVTAPDGVVISRLEMERPAAKDAEAIAAAAHAAARDLRAKIYGGQRDGK